MRMPVLPRFAVRCWFASILLGCNFTAVSTIVLTVTLIGSSGALLVGPVEADTLALHQGDVDPTSEGFGYSDNFGPASKGPVMNDVGTGLNVWSITSGSSSTQTGYGLAFTPAQNAALASQGFEMTMEARVPSGPLNSPNGNFYPSAYATVDFGSGRRFDVAIGRNSNGDTEAVLPTALVGGVNYYTPGASFTLTGSGSSYHLYQLVYNPMANAADLYIDGVDRLSGYAGQTQFFDAGGTGFDADNGGTNNCNVFEVQSTPTSLYIWTGGGTDNNWGTNGNWTGLSVIPASSSDTAIEFTGARRTNGPVQNIGNPFELNVLMFDATASGFHLSGSSLKLDRSSASILPTITQNSTALITIDSNIMLANDTTYEGNGSMTINGTVSGLGSVTKNGTGALTLTAAPSYTGNTIINGGTLLFNVTTGIATISVGATATVNNDATLELAGSVAALSSGANRENVVNNSDAPGLLISGTHQQVGNIDGSGTTQVNAGSDLTANHVIQNALVIGGASGNPGLVTIDASDAAGNPLAGPAVQVAPTSVIPGSNLGDPLGYTTNSNLLADSPPLVSSLTTAQAAVPEPSSLLLLAIGGLVVASMAFRRRRLD
jgi:autotransporter-associated beta strand protein